MDEQRGQLNALQVTGLVIFFVTAGFPALQLGGFGLGSRFDLLAYLAIALVGGAVGGALIGRRCWWAGAIGGAIAGPCGLLALAWYISGRDRVFKMELFLVQSIASLPGLMAYYLIVVLRDILAPPKALRKAKKTKRRKLPLPEDETEDASE
jgi:hypothetical protein